MGSNIKNKVSRGVFDKKKRKSLGVNVKIFLNVGTRMKIP